MYISFFSLPPRPPSTPHPPAADHSDAPAARAFAPLRIFHRGFKRRSLPIKVDKSAKMRALQTLTLLLLLHQVRRMNAGGGLKTGGFPSLCFKSWEETWRISLRDEMKSCGSRCVLQGERARTAGRPLASSRRFKYCALIIAGCILCKSAAARRQMTGE